MKVGVLGLWHLGTVTAGCLADAGFNVIGVDEADVVEALNADRLPVSEPGLSELLASGIAMGNLRFSSDFQNLADCDVVWVAYDTPVDENDNADVDYVRKRVEEAMASVRNNVVILISSQVPVGFCAEIEKRCATTAQGKSVHFAYSPENLRLGNAIDCFKNAQRIVVGTNSQHAKDVLHSLLSRFCSNLIWMSPASAEMTKHAINSYLGMVIAFANEIATICETVGADAHEVALGLKSEPRIGERAPLSPGGAFAGGTLARDITFLVDTARERNCPASLLSSIRMSNEEHKKWALSRLLRDNADLKGKAIAVLGLTYKPGTDTLRRSSSVELCQALRDAGAFVRAHDPSIKSLPLELSSVMSLSETAHDALEGAEAMILATPWPEYKSLAPNVVLDLMNNPTVLDANGFLRQSLGAEPAIKYYLVGKA